VTFIKCLAPVLPYVTEIIYKNLVNSWDSEAPESVHLCDMPVADESLRDAELEEQMNLAMRACALGRALRSKHDLKVRQPLARVFLLPPDEHSRDELAQVSDLIAEELNIKEVILVEDESEISEVSYKPNFRALGPRFGKRMKEVGVFISGLTPEHVKDLAAGNTFEVAGGTIGIDDVELQRRERDDVVVAVEDNLAVGLDVHVTEELAREGGAREFVNRVQNLRKDAGLDVSDRIRLWVQGSDVIETAVNVFRDTIATETLAQEITVGSLPETGTGVAKDLEVNDEACTVTLIKV